MATITRDHELVGKRASHCAGAAPCQVLYCFFFNEDLALFPKLLHFLCIAAIDASF